MITIDVKDYCHGCEHFDPEYVGREENEDFYGNTYICDGVVRCVHCDKCFAIEQYISKKMREEMFRSVTMKGDLN